MQQKPRTDTCITCLKTKHIRWGAGPTCNTCYRNKNKNRYTCLDCGSNCSSGWYIKNDGHICHPCGVKNDLRYQFMQSRSRAKKRGHEWEIPLEDFIVLRVLKCVYCNGWTGNTGSGLDRKDSSKGYLSDNVVPCCGPCNRIKCHLLSHNEMLEVSKLLIKMRSS